jgi:hypothetical protein
MAHLNANDQHVEPGTWVIRIILQDHEWCVATYFKHRRPEICSCITGIGLSTILSHEQVDGTTEWGDHDCDSLFWLWYGEGKEALTSFSNRVRHRTTIYQTKLVFIIVHDGIKSVGEAIHHAFKGISMVLAFRDGHSVSSKALCLVGCIRRWLGIIDSTI